MASKSVTEDHFGGNLFTFAESLNNFRQSQIVQESCSRSISSKSLSLDENLSRLFECLRLEYGSDYRLVSPKWKNFRSQKLPFSEKTRLNNAIWRCWHIQYQKSKRPFFCQFVSPLSEEREPPKKEQLAVILEGRYWKRKLEAVAREYKKWRVFYKEKWSTGTTDTALENLSIQAQICDQQIFDDLERRQKMRKRTISGSSGDIFSATSPLEYCPNQALKMVQEHMTPEVVLSAFPDTLFTTLTNGQQGPNSSTSFGSTDAPDLFQQPRLDNLQPCLDEFMEQFDNLTHILAQNEAAAELERQKQQQQQQSTAPLQGQLVNQGIPGQNRSSIQVQYTGNPDDIEMMDATGYDSLQVQDYSVNTSAPQQVCTLTPEQGFQPVVGLSADYQVLSAQLQQSPVEQMQPNNNIFSMRQEISGGVQIHSPPNVTSPLANSPITSPTLPSPGLNSPVTTSTLAQSQLFTNQERSFQLESGVTKHFRSESSESMREPVSYPSRTQSQETPAERKGRLPRNVSDSQLYTMDLSHLGSNFASSFHKTSLMPSLDSDLPPQLQAPNLAAHLQSVPSRAPRSKETRSASVSQPKKARLPRNMSDSGLYDLANVSKVGSGSVNRQLPSPNQISELQLQNQVQNISVQSQAPTLSVRQSRPTGKRKGRLPRNMSDSSLMTMQNLPRNTSDSSLVAMHQRHQPQQQQQQQQQQQRLQAPTVASLLMGSDSSRRGNLSATQTSLVNLLTSKSTNLSNQNQVIVSSNQTKASSTSVSLNPPSSTSRQISQSTLIDQLLKQPTQQSAAASFSSPNYLEVACVTTAITQTTATQKTSQAVGLSNILTSATSTQPVVVQADNTSKVSPQHQLLKHLLTLQKEKQPLPTPLLAALQASVDQQTQNINKSKQDDTRLQHQQQQQQQLQQQQQEQQQQQQLQQNRQSKLLQDQQQLQSLLQVQQQQDQQAKVHQYNHSQAQQQTQQNLPQQQTGTGQKGVSTMQGLLQIPDVGLQPTQSLVVGGNSDTQNAPPGTIVITPQQLQLNSLQNLPSKIVTLQQNTQQAVHSPPVSASNQIVEIIQGTGPPQQIVLPAGLKIRQAGPVVGAPELSSILLGQQQPQAARTYSSVQSASTSRESTESIAAALVSMAASPVIQQPAVTSPAPVPMASVAMSTCSQDSASERSPQATPNAPKPVRHLSTTDREQYKEHRRISHISAEQKRRGNIKMGFDELVMMVPSLAQQRNVKVSKATVLQKTVDYTTKLQRERQVMNEEIELLQQQKEELKAEIDACQQQLPATGAPVMRQRSEQLWAMFNEYVRSKTRENYKFWIFSLIIRPLFEAYISTVSTSSVEEFCRTVLSWLDQRCSLPALRPIPVAALRELSQHTSILTDPSKVAEEAQKAVAVENPTNGAGNFGAVFGTRDCGSEVTEFNTSLR